MSAVRSCRAVVFGLALVTASAAEAAPGADPAGIAPRRAAPQGVAVVSSCRSPTDAPPAASASCLEATRMLARAVYGSALRPRTLDEIRARVLAGDPAPPSATKEVRELGELRAAVTGDDAPSRRILSSLAEQLGVEGLLVVSPVTRASDPGAPPAAITPEPDAGFLAAAPPSHAAAADGDAGVASGAPTPEASGSTVGARLFLASSGEFDAARYEPDGSGSGVWRGVVVSLSDRFRPAPARAAMLEGTPPKLPVRGNETKPFYASPWLWGAIGAAALVGGFVWFASRDTESEPIHLQMRVPR